MKSIVLSKHFSKKKQRNTVGCLFRKTTTIERKTFRKLLKLFVNELNITIKPTIVFCYFHESITTHTQSHKVITFTDTLMAREFDTDTFRVFAFAQGKNVKIHNRLYLSRPLMNKAIMSS